MLDGRPDQVEARAPNACAPIQQTCEVFPACRQLHHSLSALPAEDVAAVRAGRRLRSSEHDGVIDNEVLHGAQPLMAACDAFRLS